MSRDDGWSVGRWRVALRNPGRPNHHSWFRFERCSQVNHCGASATGLPPVRACGLLFGCKKNHVARVEDVGTKRPDNERFIATSDKLPTRVAGASEAQIPTSLRGVQFLDKFLAQQSRGPYDNAAKIRRHRRSPSLVRYYEALMERRLQEYASRAATPETR